MNAYILTEHSIKKYVCKVSNFVFLKTRDWLRGNILKKI